MSKLIKFKTFNTRPEAELEADILKKNNVKAMVSPVGTGASHIQLQAGASELMVNEEDLEEARKILGEEGYGK
jgi:hypothetical protein